MSRQASELGEGEGTRREKAKVVEWEEWGEKDDV
jgi:hypothetical protein